MDVQLLINQTGINTEILIRRCPCIHRLSNFFMTCKFLTIAVCLTLENVFYHVHYMHMILLLNITLLEVMHAIFSVSEYFLRMRGT